MPASRSARAITLAPRSCPSSPGFATSTRILRSAITTHLTTITQPGARSAWFRVTEESKSLGVQALPQIPAGHAAVRFPALCDLFHLLWSWQLDLLLAAF